MNAAVSLARSTLVGVAAIGVGGWVAFWLFSLAFVADSDVSLYRDSSLPMLTSCIAAALMTLLQPLAATFVLLSMSLPAIAFGLWSFISLRLEGHPPNWPYLLMTLGIVSANIIGVALAQLARRLLRPHRLSAAKTVTSSRLT